MVNVSSKKRRHQNTKNDETIEREYQVEAILDKRIRGKKTQYLLKWKDYSDEHNTWEDENRLNCPDLFKEFEERLKEKTDTKKSTLRKSKNTNMQEIDEDFQSVEDQSTTTTENGTDSTKIDDDDNDDSDHNRIMTRQSPRKKARLSPPKTSSSPPTRRHSNRVIINQTKSRIASMSKDESSSGNTTEEEILPTKRPRKNLPVTRNTSNEISLITINDDNNHNNNNSIEVSGKNPIKKLNTNESTSHNPRFRVTPSSTSSISFTFNANECNSERTSTENSSEIMDETDQVERIETVRYYHNEISFRIKLIHENEAHWISSKIANRKYPQAVISFWENHVEFT
jgi:hypothetical protein